MKRVIEQISTLPELRATKGRDFGRGYSLAIKDVLSIIEKEVCE